MTERRDGGRIVKHEVPLGTLFLNLVVYLYVLFGRKAIVGKYQLVDTATFSVYLAWLSNDVRLYLFQSFCCSQRHLQLISFCQHARSVGGNQNK